MIRVLDEHKSVAVCRDASGLKPVEGIDFDGVAPVYLLDAEDGMELEQTIDKGATEFCDSECGSGDLALVVEDLDTGHDRLEAAGPSPRKPVDFRKYDALLPRLFFVKDRDGYEVEAMQRLERCR